MCQYYAHFHIYTYEEEIRNMKDNQELFSHLLEEINVVTFQELLTEHPEYIHMRCCTADKGVSF